MGHIARRNFLSRWIYCKKAATAIEYGLLAGGISLAIVIAVFALGGDLEVMFSTMSTVMERVAGDVQADLQ